jgi:Cytochrome c554 and c-prime
MVRAKHVLTLCVIALICGLLGCRRSSNSETPLARPQPYDRPRGAVPSFLMGTGSCVGRSCHGSLEPLDQPASWQMEYTLWSSRDPHARAYHVLHEPAAKQIARRLGLRDGNAHEASECLACHATPISVVPMMPAPDAQAVRRERSFGVGCEACHGSAVRWIDAHLTKAWRTKDPKAKWEDDGMVELADAATLVRTCAQCHVGDGREGRDVNHDLIAAGHPRLMFEASTYLANLPRHWKPKPRDEVQLWAVGQTVCAETAIESLKRIDVWPEFAQYDCTGCHHELSDNWRRRGGRWAWGTWYLTMPKLLAAAGKADGLPDVTALTQRMEAPLPSRSALEKLAMPALADLKRLGERLAKWKADRTFAQEKIRWLLDNPRLVEPSWDAAEQVYLAIQALNIGAQDELIQKRLGDLLTERVWPPRGGVDPGKLLSILRAPIK